MKVWNADGSPNASRSIMHSTKIILETQGHYELIRADVVELNDHLILRYNWLYWHNPEVNWKMQEVHFSQCLD